MISKWQWILLQLTHTLWIRATLICLLAVAAVFVAMFSEAYISDEFALKIGAGSVETILSILASSMLAVTTFSLTTMVSAYSAATSNVTPRATKLLVEDKTTQNVLATFIGSFLYALVGIIMLSTGMFNNQARVALFVMSIAVVVLIVVTLLRWIEHLTLFGQVGHTTDRVEQAARRAMCERAENPYLGAHPLLDPANDIPANAVPVFVDAIGYVQHVDVEALSACAQEQGGNVYVGTLPGAFIDPSRAAVWVSGIDEKVAQETVDSAFTIDTDRSFTQDPRFGMSVLAEIASRALSSGMNDAGTAIDVIGRAVRVLETWSGAPVQTEDDVRCPGVHVPAVRVDELFNDIFAPIARDGAAVFEVQIRLQKALATLAALDPGRFAEAARHHSRVALERAEAHLELEEERARVREVARTIA